MLGVSENSDEIPEHRNARTLITQTSESGTQFTKEQTKNLQKTALASKVVNPFTRALAPPFYRETKGLLHSENTLESKKYS
jgi:hypothetical protein